MIINQDKREAGPFSPRGAGVLLPIFSLYGKDGIGNFAKPAYEFVEFLAQAGHSYWQTLPLNPTGEGDSPYQSFSAFALNPFFIDLEDLRKRGLVSRKTLREYRKGFQESQINYGQIYKKIFPFLKNALARMEEDFLLKQYEEAEDYWLDDYALFMAIKEETGMLPLWKWPEDLRNREEKALSAARERLKEGISFYKKIQYLLDTSFKGIKNRAEEKHVKIIGDMPIYVAEDSADFWAHKGLFKIGKDGRPDRIAGCPPDGFCPVGQRWGNPLYNWEVHRKDNFSWWQKRFQRSSKHYHGIRLDHFRGLSGYYSIDAIRDDGLEGVWEKGPGIEFINAVKKSFVDFLIIAENLGHLTEDVDRLLDESGLPGMNVIQFAFDKNPDNTYLPHTYKENAVAYTGTHDNDSLLGWLNNLSEAQREDVADYFGEREPDKLRSVIIKTLYKSKAFIVICPLQDWLGLGSGSRINTPGTLYGNWKFRINKKALRSKLATSMRALVKESQRLP